MPLLFPSNQNEVFNRAIADFQNELPDAGPFLRSNFVYALILAYSARVFDNYQLLSQLLKQMFPDTATGDFLSRWGGYVGVNPIGSTASQGPVTVVGLTGSSIPIYTQLKYSDGTIYQTTTAAAVAKQTFSIASLTRSGNTVTATTTGTHSFATGIRVDISGADQAGYNGNYLITVTGLNQFIYTIPTSPATPATSTIDVNGLRAVMFGASLAVESIASGKATNLPSGAKLTLVTPISGVDSNTYVQYASISGGTDQESDDRYRLRVLETYQNPTAPFNDAAIKKTCKELAFVDRVYVNDCVPTVGDVTIYFTTNNTTTIIPSASEVTQLYQKVLTIKPAQMAASDLHVVAPTALPVNFTVANLVPNTVTMQSAIVTSLGLLFREELDVGIDLTAPSYLSAIWQTVDLTTGDTVRSFNVTSPAATITVASNELPVLGNITFS